MSGGWSETRTFFEGQWHEGNAPILGPRSHAFWLGSTVFDGARAFEGVAPDLDRHMARVNRSAEVLGLIPRVSVGEWLALAADGFKQFRPDAALYVRPMYWAEQGGPVSVPPDPDSTRWCLCLYEAPMPAPTGFSITLSPFRKPTRECATVEAKAACLYPNNGRALLEARARGFDNCAMTDMLGNVAETGTSNVWLAKDGIVMTPAANGTFLAGITRARVMALLRGAGIEVREATLRWDDFRAADEVFTTGNYAKVVPVTRVEDRTLQPGPMFRRARDLYWDFAHAAPKAA